MENQLYGMMADSMEGGLHIPLNQPSGGSQNKRLRGRGGDKAADFPSNTVLGEPVHKNAQ